ncbi:MAG: hypothetical protein WD013_04625, partial [Gemmatimonadota bacterium]
RIPFVLVVLGALLGCEGSTVSPPQGGPAPPAGIAARYFEHAVELSWELAESWNGESFRVYGKRGSDPAYFLIAEVTSCANGFCFYSDLNVVPDAEYEYEVVAVDDQGRESSPARVGPIEVPQPVAPPVPEELEAVALDASVFLRWGTQSLEADDFSFYRVYLEELDGTVVLLGETDSEGFVDLLAENGTTYGYFVTAVDEQGHESEGSVLVEATPRPDFHGELLFAFQDDPALSGFRFQDTEDSDPVLAGDDPDRDFRLEMDPGGFWLVPGPGVEVHSEPLFTTALRCGVGADGGCIDLPVAPADGYQVDRIALVPELSYVVRVPGGAGSWHYGVLRVVHIGETNDGSIAIFDWAFQRQADNRNLAPPSDDG